MEDNKSKTSPIKHMQKIHKKIVFLVNTHSFFFLMLNKRAWKTNRFLCEEMATNSSLKILFKMSINMCFCQVSFWQLLLTKVIELCILKHFVNFARHGFLMLLCSLQSLSKNDFSVSGIACFGVICDM